MAKAKPPKTSIPENPLQPFVRDHDGRLHFRKNAIVKWLVDQVPGQLNTLNKMPFSDEDWAQLLQLLGYSPCSFGESPRVSDTLEAMQNGY